MYLYETATKALKEHDGPRTRISKAIARNRYGIVTSHNDYRYYLLPNGTVIDSDGDERYIPPARLLSLSYCRDCRAHHTANSTELRSCDIPF